MECSYQNMYNINEIFHEALKHGLYPTPPPVYRDDEEGCCKI